MGFSSSAYHEMQRQKSLNTVTDQRRGLTSREGLRQAIAEPSNQSNHREKAAPALLMKFTWFKGF
jgi:hypothetical protein